MSKSRFITTIFILTLALTAMVSAPAVMAMEPSQARVLDITGEAHFLKAGAPDWAALQAGMTLSEGDKIKTGKDSEVRIELAGANKTAEITVRTASEFTFETLRHDKAALLDTTLLNVEVGGVLVKGEKLIGDSKFEVKTPTSIVGIRGTTFEVYASKAS